MSVVESIRPVALGEALGSVYLPECVLSGAAALAKEFYAHAVAIDFAEQVETYSMPSWLKAVGDDFIPDVSEFGFAVTKNRGEIVATSGVDPHIDGAHGFVLLIVLHNDGLTFKQGRRAHKHVAGEWFIFDDRLNHGVRETRKDGAYVGWAIPLKKL